MSDDPNDTTNHEPWKAWGLTPYDPTAEDTAPPVSLCAPAIGGDRHPQVVAYGELPGRVMCDARMTYRGQRERGRFGRRSMTTHTRPCPCRAQIAVLFDDGSVAYRCRSHMP